MQQARPRRASTVAMLLAVLVLLPGSLWSSATATDGSDDQREDAATKKIEPALLADLDEHSTDSFVIEFAGTAELDAARRVRDWADRGQRVMDALRETAAASQADVIAALKADDVEFQSFWINNTVHVSSGTRPLAVRIAGQGEVTAVRTADSVPLEKPAPAPRKAAVDGVEWGVADIRADQVWNRLGMRGEGLVVANIDSGVQYDHPALAASYRGNTGDGGFDHDYSWWDPTGICGSPSTAPCDNVGHGSHTMGTMVGDGGPGNRIGVAPGARWIAAKGCEYLSCGELALTSSAQWVLAPTDLQGANPDPSRRPHIVNNSWGGAGGVAWYEDFVDAWVAAGIFPVFANGNSGPSCQTTGAPGEYAAAYSVGNYTADGTIAEHSSRGPGTGGVTKPDIAAPGTDVRSSVPGSGYEAMSGTSMAAPHLAGTVALLWSAAPSLIGDIAGTRQLLDDSARDTADSQCGGDDDDNNVYGEGRLDALAVVTAAPRGPTGSVRGTILDTSTNAPATGVRLDFTGASDRTAVTNDAGRFSIALTPGTYDVEVTKFGYDDQDFTAHVRAGDILTRDLQLDVTPRVRMRGVVTDGSGQGWPLYARVDIPGTPVSTFTDPTTGAYTLQVPEGRTHRVRIAAEYPGYVTRSDDVEVEGRTRHDAELDADPTTCTAPGYKRVGGLSEEFDSGEPPAGWSVQNHSGSPFVWEFDDPGERGNLTGGTGGFVSVDQLAYHGAGLPHTSLVSPEVDLSHSDAPVLEFANALQLGPLSKADVDVSLDGGTSWTTIWAKRSLGPGTVRIPAPEAANEPSVRLRFRYQYGAHTWYWQIDDVFLGQPTCEPVSGGLLVGHTRSSLTRRILDDVTISADGLPPVSSAATPEDERLRDGFYWLYVPAGRHRVAASTYQYADEVKRLRVRAGETVRQDFGLASGRLVAIPRTIVAEVRAGRVATRRLTLANTGDARAHYELDEVESRRPRAGRQPARVAEGAPLHEVKADITPLPTLPTPHDPRRTGQGASQVADHGPSWTDLSDFPMPIESSAAGAHGGRVYSFGGTGLDGKPFAGSFGYDKTTNEWSEVAEMPSPRQKPAGAFLGNRFVVTGGWGPGLQPEAATDIYDPETDTWSAGAPNPSPWAASGSAVLDGKLYVVGGCGAEDCGRTDVLRYDPASETWTRLADFPQRIAWTSCGAIGGQVYCAGGYGQGADSFSTFAYDPAGDEWTQVADMPVDMWASAHVVADEQLIVAGGAAHGSSVITNETFAYDPALDSWTPMPRSNHATYRSAGACGFTKIGGSEGDFSSSPVVEQLPGFDDCRPATDLPWLRPARTRGSVGPERSRSITIKLDARHIADPGVHTGYLRFDEDTPYPTRDVRIRMVVRRSGR